MVDGYAILQPRASISLTSSQRFPVHAPVRRRSGHRSLHARGLRRLSGSLRRRVVHRQGHLRRGGASRRPCAGRFPENLILSHDLLESGYARSALVTDVDLIEEHPISYAMEASRRHRWTRGDWQLAGWLLPRVPGPGGKRQPNPLSPLSVWKLFDNLRRSLVPAALVALCVGGWLWGPGPSWLWPLLVAGALFLPPLLTAAIELVRKPAEREWLLHLTLTGKSAGPPAPARAAGADPPALRRTDLPRRHPALGREHALHPARAAALASALLRRRNARRTPRRASFGRCGSPRSGVVLAVVLILVPATRAGRLAVRRPAAGALAGRRPSSAGGSAGRCGPPAAELEPLSNRRSCGRWPGGRGATSPISSAPRDNWLPPDNYQEYPSSMRRPAHLAHEHRHGAAGEPGRARFRLHLHRRVAAPDRSDAADDGEARTLPRPFLQLVRHAHAAAASPAVRLFGRQRQSRRQPADPASGARRVEGSAGARARALCDGIEDTLLALAAHAPRRRLPRSTRQIEALQEPSALGERRARRPRPAAQALLERALPRHQGNWWPHCPSDGRGRAQVLGAGAQPPVPQVPRRPEIAGARTRASACSTLEEWPQRCEDRATDRRRSAGREAADGPSTSLIARCHELSAMDFEFLYDRSRDLLSIGYDVGERRRDPSWYDLLASEARLTSFPAHRPGPGAAEALVRSRPPADEPWRRRQPDLVERLDVRVPHAAAVPAELREHAAGAGLPGRGVAPDRVRPATPRALGHFRVVLQRRRHEPGLSVPGVRRSRAGLQARTGRRPGHRPLRQRARADGRARGRRAATCRRSAAAASSATTGSTRPSTTRRRACSPARTTPSCAASWPTTRA